MVTGAGRGIGKRIAIGFARQGARVGLVARSKAELDLASLEIEHDGGNALRLRADVRDHEQVTAAADRFRVRFGAVDVLVCAAAVQGPIGPLVRSSPQQWAETIDTALNGTMHAVRAVVPEMVERRSGKVIVLVGSGANGARPNFSAYAAAQAGLVRLVETLAFEVCEFNVQVNCIHPGSAYTHMTDEVLRAGEAAGWREEERATHVRRTGGTPPDDQIALALFLASERANHIYGRFIDVSDDWERLESVNLPPDALTLRRVHRV